jgi:hypothetical protein
LREAHQKGQLAIVADYALGDLDDAVLGDLFFSDNRHPERASPVLALEDEATLLFARTACRWQPLGLGEVDKRVIHLRA